MMWRDGDLERSEFDTNVESFGGGSSDRMELENDKLLEENRKLRAQLAAREEERREWVDTEMWNFVHAITVELGGDKNSHAMDEAIHHGVLAILGAYDRIGSAPRQEEAK